ncbi:MAG: hypothetical protein HRT35_05200 [Algicola sp.]|nr:hypothetical protein [Algicola sp.]
MVKTINIKAIGQKLVHDQGCHHVDADDEFKFINPMNKPVMVTLIAVDVNVPGNGESVPQSLNFNYTVDPGKSSTFTDDGGCSGQASGSIIVDP